MQTVASLEISQARLLLQRLKKAAIPVEVRTVMDDSGIEFSDVVVEDSYYERGCDVVEAWAVEIIAVEEKRSRLPCPKCRSRHTETIPHGEFDYIYQCKDCGEEFEN